jgi:hypothetical protein
VKRAALAAVLLVALVAASSATARHRSYRITGTVSALPTCESTPYVLAYKRLRQAHMNAYGFPAKPGELTTAFVHPDGSFVLRVPWRHVAVILYIARPLIYPWLASAPVRVRAPGVVNFTAPACG